MDKVEKFKELLEGLEYTGELIGRSTTLKELEVHMPKKIRLEEELIKMYEEKQEKPVIRCKELYVNMNQKYGYELQFVSLKNNEVKTYKGTLSCKEKDGMLITDDFIFIKEWL